MKLNINNATSRPFSVNTIWDESAKNEKVAHIVKEYSRLKHGRKKEFVDQEITTRIGIDMNSGPVDIDAKKEGAGGAPAEGAGGLAALLGQGGGDQ